MLKDRVERMRPSLEVASRVADIANTTLVISLVVGVISTGLVVWMSNVKEYYWDKERADAKSSIASAAAKAALADRNAANADQARRNLEQRLAPRKLSQDQIDSISKAMSAFALSPSHSQAQAQWAFVFAFPPSYEASSLADQIRGALDAAGWKTDGDSSGFEKLETYSGVVILATPSSRGKLLANELSNALKVSNITSRVIEDISDHLECKKFHIGEEIDHICSAVTIVVGGHPD